jgi:hypothetical protein
MRKVPIFMFLLAVACRGERAGSTPEAARLAHVMDSLRPAVEQAVGLTFKSPPRSAIRSREDVRRYHVNKLDEELTPERERGV